MADSTLLQAVSDDYMQPIDEGTLTTKPVIIGKRSAFIINCHIFSALCVDFDAI